MLRCLGEELAALLARGLGRGKKVAVLDCDNTLWGGIIGEDGPTGIRLDPHEYPGCAFHAFQRQLLELQRAGVLLALCSKNNEVDVMEVLQDHPHMVIRCEHLAAWEINWDNKVDGKYLDFPPVQADYKYCISHIQVRSDFHNIHNTSFFTPN